MRHAPPLGSAMRHVPSWTSAGTACLTCPPTSCTATQSTVGHASCGRATPLILQTTSGLGIFHATSTLPRHASNSGHTKADRPVESLRHPTAVGSKKVLSSHDKVACGAERVCNALGDSAWGEAPSNSTTVHGNADAPPLSTKVRAVWFPATSHTLHSRVATSPLSRATTPEAAPPP